MRIHHVRITGAGVVLATLLGSTSAAVAAQQPAQAARSPVIVILRSQFAAAPAGTAAFSRRIAGSRADQAPLISAAVKLGAKNIRQYQLVNSFAATVPPQARAKLVAAHVHHLEDRGAAARRRCEEAGAERMAGEELGIETDAPGARLDHPDHGVIGQALGADPATFGH